MATTPGPWIVERHSNRLNEYRDSYFVCSEDRIIAEYANESDARLIAAAPDLLAACESAHARFTVEDPEDWAVYQALEAAINKARGE